MRVLNVNSLLDPVTGGGTAERTLQISKVMSRAGCSVEVLTLDIGLTRGSLPRTEGLNVVYLPCLSGRFHIPKVSLGVLRQKVRGVDIIHLMGHWSLLNALVYIAARIERKPYVVCPAGALPIFGRSRVLKKLYNWVVGNLIIRHASAWIAITETERSHFSLYGVDSRLVSVIPNGVDPADFPAESHSFIRDTYQLGDHPYILFLGRLNEIKGPDLLLAAFCSVQAFWPDLHLVYVGPDGGMLNTLRGAAQAGLVDERVHFLGYLGGQEKAAVYQCAQFLVIPSRQEAMSIVVLEAGISAVPVLLTDQCGFDEVEAIGGGLVVSASVDGLEDGLRGMLSATPNDLIAMGNKLHDFVVDNFTWEIVIKKYIAVYRKILKDSRVAS